MIECTVIGPFTYFFLRNKQYPIWYVHKIHCVCLQQHSNCFREGWPHHVLIKCNYLKYTYGNRSRNEGDHARGREEGRKVEVRTREIRRRVEKRAWSWAKRGGERYDFSTLSRSDDINPCFQLCEINWPHLVSSPCNFSFPSLFPLFLHPTPFLARFKFTCTRGATAYL